MLRALFAAVMLQAPPTPAGIVRYEERATLDSSRTAVQLRIVLAGRGVAVDVPLRWTSTDAVHVEASAGATARVTQSGGELRLSIHAAPDADTTDVRVELTAPQTGGAFEHRFVAPSGMTVQEYALALRLPRNSVPQSISWSGPKGQGPSAHSPLRVTHDSLSRVVSLELSGVGDGDIVRLAVDTAPQRRSPIALILGAALAVAWLVAFRDLVRGRTGESSTVP